MKQTKKWLSLVLCFALIAVQVPTFAAALPAPEYRLFISEYVEGSGYNKAIELYNGTGTKVNLSKYSLELYSNGNTSANTTQSLDGTLNAGDVYVIANSKASETILNIADMTSEITNFNGDDAVVLKYDGAIIDSVGDVGEDIKFGKDVTLIRKPDVFEGNYGSFDLDSEWDSQDKDALDDLGSHTSSADAPINVPLSATHSPVENAKANEPITLIADVVDDDVYTVTLNFKAEDGESKIVSATNTTSASITLTIPAEEVTSDITYNLDISNDNGETLRLPKEGDYAISVETPVITGSIKAARDAGVGSDVVVTGVITYIDNKNLYIQDDQAGIVVRTNASGFKLGDEITATGTTSEYYKLFQMVTDDITVNGTQEIPTAKVAVAGLDESLEAYKVAIENFTVKNIDKYGNASCDSNGTEFIILSKKNNDLKVEKDKAYKLVEGVVTYNYGAYKIFPTKLVEKDDTPNPTLEHYEVTVSKIVDGDTIHIEPAILGSKKIRMVNMDTPETYHKVNNNADLLQKQYGDRAKDGLDAMIAVGDTVTISLDPTNPTDQYGRLLAQIYDEDKRNVNLEMVRQGHAVNYFIWPVQSWDDYRAYQIAVREAIDNKRGMWAETSDDFELPFVFRARNQGKGLQRYVGNSDTKEYYYPKNYDLVPVDKRVFFKPESQAIEQGYTLNADQPIPPEDVYVKATIAQARDMDMPSKVIVDGIVTYVDGKNFYVEDASGSMVFRSDSFKANVGDKLKIKGGTSEYFGLFQIVSDDIERLSQGHDVSPTQIAATEIGEDTEAKFVKLSDLTVIGPDPDDANDERNQDATYILKDKDDNKVYVRTKYQDAPTVGATFSAVEGVITYSWGKYKIIPSNYLVAQNEYTVTFETNHYMYKTKTVTVNEGAAVDAYTLDDTYYWLFDGWYTDDSLTEKFDFDTPIAEDITLYAKWIYIYDLGDYLQADIDELTDEYYDGEMSKDEYYEAVKKVLENPRYDRICFATYSVGRLIRYAKYYEMPVWYFNLLVENVLYCY